MGNDRHGWKCVDESAESLDGYVSNLIQITLLTLMPTLYFADVFENM